MPELPKVSQEFTADVSDYVAKMQLMIDETERFVGEIDDAIAKLGEFKAALASIPDKEIKVTLEGEDEVLEQVAYIREIVNGLEDKTITVAVKYVQEGNPDDIKAATETLQEHVNVTEDVNDNLGNLADQIDEVQKANELLNDSAGDTVDRLIAESRAATAASGSASDLRDELEHTVGAFDDVGEAADRTGKRFSQYGLTVNQVAFADLYGLKTTLSATEQAALDAGSGITKMSEASAASVPLIQALGNGWGFFTTKVQLWGGLLPGITGHVAGWHIATDALIESIIGVTGAVIAFGAGMIALEPAASDLYNHLRSVWEVSTALGVQIKPLNGWFESLQRSMAPDVVEAYGAALSTFTGKDLGALGTAIQGVGREFDDGIIAISQYLQKNDDLAKIVSNGSEYLRQFAEIAGNVAVAINNLIKADPGTVHFLLDFLDGVSKLLVVITKLPTPVLEFALAMHSIWLWGGLAGNAIVGLLGPISNVITRMGGFKAAELAVVDENASNMTQLKTSWGNLGTVFSNIWGGITGIAGKISSYFKNILTAMAEADGAAATMQAGFSAAFGGIAEKLSALAASPWLWVTAGVAAIGLLVYQFENVSNQAKNFGSSLESSLANTNIQQSLTAITNDIGTLNQKIASTNIAQQLQTWNNLSHTGASLADDFHADMDDLGKSFTDFFSGNMVGAMTSWGKALEGVFVPGQGAAIQAAQNIKAYNATINQMLTQTGNVAKAGAGIMKSTGDNFAQSLGVMSLAGVSATDSFATMETKISGLLTGYQNLGVQGPVLAGAVNAVTFATEQQNSQVTKLTQGITTWLSTITGGESGLVSFAQGMQGLSSAATSAGDTIEVANGKTTISTGTLKAAGTATKVVGDAMDGLSTNALNLRSAFEQQINTTGTAYNSLMTLTSAAGEGAKGTQQLTQFTKDAVAELLPFAGTSQQAQQQVLSMAESMGYTGTTIQGLTKWVGNIANPLQNMNSLMAKATIAAGNLATDANNLADALNSNLNQAIAAAIIQANGGQKAFDNFADAAVKSHDNMNDMKTSALALAEELITATGNTASAKNEFDVMATQLGLTKTKADLLWNSVAKLATAIDGLHSKTITITANEITTGSLASAGIESSALPKIGGATGMLVPGHGSGDTVPAMLTPGEAVVPKHLVSAVAPILAAGRVPGFASGGIVMAAPMLPPAPDLTGLALLQQQLTGLGGNVSTDTSQVAAAALVVAKAQASLTAAQKTLTTDQADIKTLDAKTAAAKALDTKAAATLKAAETAESTAKSHVTALEKLYPTEHNALALTAAKNIYNAAASKVTKDKTALAAAAKLVSQDSSVLSNAKSAEVSAAANYLNMQRLERNDQTALALAQLDQKQTQTQLSQLQKIQAGGASISSMNDLLLPGTPLATLAAAMPGVGLAWGAPAASLVTAATAAASASTPATSTVPVLSFDSGGYLPPGLSLAVNGTGAPEAVGGAQELHSHISVNLDGQQIWQAVQKQGLRYGLRNNGLATGLMKPR